MGWEEIEFCLGGNDRLVVCDKDNGKEGLESWGSG